MTLNRSTRLRQALAQLQLKWGDQIVAPASERARVSAPSGFAALDAALSGGFAVPSLAAVRGSATSGATTTALYTLARFQQQHDVFGAFIDLASWFDPHLADLAGVDIGRLLVSRPDSLSAALTVLRDILKHGKAGVIIIDMGANALTLSPEDARRLAEALKRSDSVVIALNGAPNAGADTLADVRLRFERQSWIVREGFHVGLRTRVEIARRLPNQPQPVEFDLVFGDLA